MFSVERGIEFQVSVIHSPELFRTLAALGQKFAVDIEKSKAREVGLEEPITSSFS
jgi:hypothetical protein